MTANQVFIESMPHITSQSREQAQSSGLSLHKHFADKRSCCSADPTTPTYENFAKWRQRNQLSLNTMSSIRRNQSAGKKVEMSRLRGAASSRLLRRPNGLQKLSSVPRLIRLLGLVTISAWSNVLIKSPSKLHHQSRS